MLNRTLAGMSDPRRLLSILFTCAVYGCLCGSAAQLWAEDDESGSGNRQFRNQAIDSIPFQQLNQATQEKISDILQRPSIYRRLPIATINVDPDYFQFLVRYPEVIVNIWQLMGVTQMKTERTGPFSIDTDDGAGTLSSLELIYGNENTHIFYGTGTYEGPVIRRKLTGRCVLVLRTNYETDAQGQPVATNQLDVFLKIDNTTMGLVAKSISPIVGSTADENFTESLKFVQRLNETTENNGPGVQQMGNRMRIDDDVRQKFIEVAGLVYDRAIRPANEPAAIPTGDATSSFQSQTNPVPPATYQPAYATPAQPRYYVPSRTIEHPQSFYSGRQPVIDRFSDQRFGTRNGGFAPPIYQPYKRY